MAKGITLENLRRGSGETEPMKYQITVLILWLIAILTTYFVVAELQIMTRLAPLYFILHGQKSGNRAQSLSPCPA